MAIKKRDSGDGASTSPTLPDDAPSSTTSSDDSGAPQSEQRDVRHWHDRWRSACKLYDQWAKDFNVRKAEDFFEGRQWPEAFRTGDPQTEPYAINITASTINVRIPSLYFYHPHVRVGARPWRSDDQLSQVQERAVLQENTVNTVVMDPRTGYLDETTHALLDAFFRFGVIEEGYTADWIYNPNAGKPALTVEEQIASPDKAETKIPDRYPKKDSEHCYVRHIPAETFRVAMHSGHRLEGVDWYGYREWHYISDLREDKSLSRTSRLKPQARLSSEMQDKTATGDSDRERYGLDADLPSRRGMVCILKIWDCRTKTRFIIPENQRFYLLKPTPYKASQHSVIKLGTRVKGWYPYPPASQWLHPQHEYNETREMQRIHRRRFHRRYKAVTNSIEPEEMAKLETGSDGTIIFVKSMDTLVPVEDAHLDPAVARNMGAALNDFAQVAVGGEGRGIAEADTATQANIVDARAQVKENYSRAAVARWHADIGRKLLLNIRHYATLPFWIQRNVDLLSEGAPEETVKTALLWEQIQNGEALGDISLDVSVDMESLSPINDVTERQDWTQILTLLANPNLLMLMGSSDAILKMTLQRYGIRSGLDIKEIRQAIRVVLAANGILPALQAGEQMSGMMDMAKGTPGGSMGQMGPRPLQPGSPQLGQTAMPGPTPTNTATKLQLARQGQ